MHALDRRTPNRGVDLSNAAWVCLRADELEAARNAMGVTVDRGGDPSAERG